MQGLAARPRVVIIPAGPASTPQWQHRQESSILGCQDDRFPAQFFQLSLTDDDNNLLEMNGGDFSITLSIHFSKKRTPFTSEEYLQKRPSQTPAIEEQPKEQPKEKKRNKKKQK